MIKDTDITTKVMLTIVYLISTNEMADEITATIDTMKYFCVGIGVELNDKQAGTLIDVITQWRDMVSPRNTQELH